MRIVTAMGCLLMVAIATAQTPAPKHTVTPEEYERWKKAGVKIYALFVRTGVWARLEQPAGGRARCARHGTLR
jgi:hypothetical protein